MTTDIMTALALVLVIEGLIYALFPETMQRMMERLMVIPPASLRSGGLMVAIIGVGVVWLIRG
jgi:hypothetical protein